MLGGKNVHARVNYISRALTLEIAISPCSLLAHYFRSGGRNFPIYVRYFSLLLPFMPFRFLDDYLCSLEHMEDAPVYNGISRVMIIKFRCVSLSPFVSFRWQNGKVLNALLPETRPLASPCNSKLMVCIVYICVMYDIPRHGNANFRAPVKAPWDL